MQSNLNRTQYFDLNPKFDGLEESAKRSSSCSSNLFCSFNELSIDTNERPLSEQLYGGQEIMLVEWTGRLKIEQRWSALSRAK